MLGCALQHAAHPGALEQMTMPALPRPPHARLFAAPALVELLRHGELMGELQVQALLVAVRYDDEHAPGDAILIMNWRSVDPPHRSYRQVHHFSAATHEDPVGHANNLMQDLIKQGPVPNANERQHRTRRTQKRRTPAST